MRRLVALSVVPLMLFGVAACGGEETSSSSSKDETSTASAEQGTEIEGLTVSGDVGEEPEVTIEKGLSVDETQVEILETGDGNPVVANEQALLHLYLGNGRTGKKAAATYDQGQPTALTMAEDQLFPQVLDALVGQPQGSRIAIASPVKEVYGDAGASQLGLKATDTAVFVVDVISVEPKDVLDAPEGEATEVPSDLPTIVEEDGNVTGLDFSKAAAKGSKKLQVVTLIEGDGAEARDDSLVTFDYFGAVYGAKKAFDESFSKEPVTFPLGTNGLIKAWDEGLVGVKAGSRVMIVAPPEFGYGEAGNPQGGIKKNATLVFVVDILGVDA